MGRCFDPTVYSAWTRDFNRMPHLAANPAARMEVAEAVESHQLHVSSKLELLPLCFLRGFWLRAGNAAQIL